MAKAKTKTTVKVKLTLNEDEAQVLAEVLGAVGGSPDGLRKHADAVAGALYDVGYTYSGVATSTYPFDRHSSGTLFFKD